MISVLVAGDDRPIRDRLVALLGTIDGIIVVGTAADGAEAVRMSASHRPDVVLMDLRMQILNGIDATRALASTQPHTAVLVVTTPADDDSIIGALRAGARGYLTKGAGRTEIAAAVRAAAAGHSPCDAAVSVPALNASTGEAHLTGRETDVLRLMAGGLSNRAIAAALLIREATVKTHINNVFAKIWAKNRADAVRYAIRTGLAE